MENTYVKPLQTMMEVFESLPEGTLAQLIQNNLVISPAPSDPHQKASDKIHRRLGDYVEENELGETRAAPYDVYLNRRNAFQPDIIYIAKDSLDKIQPNGFHGAPDLVIEILSPASWHYDKGAKKDEYERNGVKEYWLVDPITKDTEGFWLVNGEYEPLPSENGKIAFCLFGYTLAF